MPKTAEPKAKAEVEPQSRKVDQVDAHAASVFAALGYGDQLPDGLVEMYRKFKKAKDVISPTRLTAEGFAFVATMWEFTK